MLSLPPNFEQGRIHSCVTHSQVVAELGGRHSPTCQPAENQHLSQPNGHTAAPVRRGTGVHSAAGWLHGFLLSLPPCQGIALQFLEARDAFISMGAVIIITIMVVIYLTWVAGARAGDFGNVSGVAGTTGAGMAGRAGRAGGLGIEGAAGVGNSILSGAEGGAMEFGMVGLIVRSLGASTIAGGGGDALVAAAPTEAAVRSASWRLHGWLKAEQVASQQWEQHGH